jgi:hypothetical protein
MSKYIVRFTSKKYSPDFGDLTKYKLKLGTFHHYRNIEDKVRQDKEEGQRGLDLIIKKPCEKLDEFIEKDTQGFIKYDDKNYLNVNGEFNAETHILVHEHSYEFNSWIFCFSIIDDLSLIPKLEEYFECDSHYFVSDLRGFMFEIQNALAESLKHNSVDKNGKPIILHGKAPNVWIEKSIGSVMYGISEAYQKITVNTLTEFMNSTKFSEINKNSWFHKPKQFALESELRIVFYPTAGKDETIMFNINDDFRLLECNLTGYISSEPIIYEM